MNISMSSGGGVVVKRSNRSDVSPRKQSVLGCCQTHKHHLDGNEEFVYVFCCIRLRSDTLHLIFLPFNFKLNNKFISPPSYAATHTHTPWHCLSMSISTGGEAREMFLSGWFPVAYPCLMWQSRASLPLSPQVGIRALCYDLHPFLKCQPESTGRKGTVWQLVGVSSAGGVAAAGWRVCDWCCLKGHRTWLVQWEGEQWWINENTNVDICTLYRLNASSQLIMTSEDCWNFTAR